MCLVHVGQHTSNVKDVSEYLALTHTHNIVTSALQTPKKSSSNDLLGLDSAFSSQQPAAPQTSTTETFNPWGGGASTASSSIGNGIPQTQPVTTATSNNPFQTQTTAAAGGGASGDPWGAQTQPSGTGWDREGEEGGGVELEGEER